MAVSDLKMIKLLSSVLTISLLFVSCRQDNVLPKSVVKKTEIDRKKKPKKSPFPKCRADPKIQIITQDISDTFFNLPNGQCLNPRALKFLGKTAVLFRFSESDRSHLCLEHIDFADLKFNFDEYEPQEGASGGQGIFKLSGDEAELSLVNLKSQINLLEPPYKFSSLSQEVIEAYANDVNEHVLAIKFTESSYDDGGEVPIRFKRLARAISGPQRSFANEGMLPRAGPQGQAANDPLKHYFVPSAKTAGDPSGMSSMTGFAYAHARKVRLFPADGLKSPYSLVGAERAEFQSSHDFYAMGQQILPSGDIYIEHGVARDQLFRMTPIFDLTEMTITSALEECLIQ